MMTIATVMQHLKYGKQYFSQFRDDRTTSEQRVRGVINWTAAIKREYILNQAFFKR
jgi:hypothetical protein